MIVALLTVVAALPASGVSSRIEMDLRGGIDAQTMSDTRVNAQPSGDALGGDITLRISAFHRRVVDDDAAPPLQPFLQRVARFAFEIGGGSTTATFPDYVYAGSAFPQRYTTVNGAVHARGGADGYLGRYAYLGGFLGVRYASWEPQQPAGFGNITPAAPIPHPNSSEVAIDASLAAGFRWRDLLAYAGWSVTPTRIGSDAFHVQFWGGAFAGVHAVVRRRWALDARVDLLDGGARAEASATLWLRRRFGFTVALEGGHGAFDDSPVTYDRAGGRVGVDWWLSPRIAAALAYAPAWQATTPVAGFGAAEPEFGFVEHVVTLTLTSRPGR